MTGRGHVSNRQDLVRAERLFEPNIPLDHARQFEFRIESDDRSIRRCQSQRRGYVLVRSERIGNSVESLSGNERKHVAETLRRLAISEIVEDAQACTQHKLSCRISGELIGKASPWSEVIVGRCIELRSARRQADRSQTIKMLHSKSFVTVRLRGRRVQFPT